MCSAPRVITLQTRAELSMAKKISYFYIKEEQSVVALGYSFQAFLPETVR
jgi:hypothetical protein